jgi:hypothetical protein
VVTPEHSWHSISQCVRAARRDTGLKRPSRSDPPPAEGVADVAEDDDEKEVQVLDEGPGDETSGPEPDRR